MKLSLVLAACGVVRSHAAATQADVETLLGVSLDEILDYDACTVKDTFNDCAGTSVSNFEVVFEHSASSVTVGVVATEAVFDACVIACTTAMGSSCDGNLDSIAKIEYIFTCTEPSAATTTVAATTTAGGGSNTGVTTTTAAAATTTAGGGSNTGVTTTTAAAATTTTTAGDGSNTGVTTTTAANAHGTTISLLTDGSGSNTGAGAVATPMASGTGMALVTGSHNMNGTTMGVLAGSSTGMVAGTDAGVVAGTTMGSMAGTTMGSMAGTTMGSMSSVAAAITTTESPSRRMLVEQLSSSELGRVCYSAGNLLCDESTATSVAVSAAAATLALAAVTMC